MMAKMYQISKCLIGFSSFVRNVYLSSARCSISAAWLYFDAMTSVFISFEVVTALNE